MSAEQNGADKKRTYVEFREDIGNKTRRICNDMLPSKLPNGQLENEKRVRREIANCNERRRMQSINCGFDSLRVLLPPMTDGEKVSKATILQLTAKYINSLVARVHHLESEIALYRRASGINPASVACADSIDSSNLRKRKVDDSKKLENCRIRRRKEDTSHEMTHSDVKFDDDSDEDIDPNLKLDSLGNLSVSTDDLSSPPTSLSYSSESPRQENASCAAARLEHLVMAIEQIEGSRSFTVATGTECHEEIIPVEQTHNLHGDSLLNTEQDSMQHFTYTPATGIPKGDLFPGVFSTNSLTTLPNETDVFKPDLTEGGDIQEYPVVTKLIHRPIPHKYLHRPQVVVNSTH